MAYYEGLYAACLTEFPVVASATTVLYPCIYTYMAVFVCTRQEILRCSILPVNGKIYPLSYIWETTFQTPRYTDYQNLPPSITMGISADQRGTADLFIFLKRENDNKMQMEDMTDPVAFTVTKYPASLRRPDECSHLKVRNVTITLNGITNQPVKFVLARYLSLVPGCQPLPAA
ncbi:ORF46 [Ranid herpesvirus 2]|uniref:ORF46 n=1 Tax=Ranid herpesvirus 2 TaxID=389214 RepID=Q14W60_9VIRU|nr:ORF46 [Ranid herpesvirus 2]ABG25691.1 ORF46 [Ranid herpesvirus 2]